MSEEDQVDDRDEQLWQEYEGAVAEVERLEQTLSAVIAYTELSEQDIEQAKFEAGCD